MSTTTVALLLYIFTRVGAWVSFFSGMFVTSFIIVGLAAFTYIVWFACSNDDCYSTTDSREWHATQRAKFTSFVKKYIIPAWIVFGAIHLIMPNQKDMMLIVGGAVGYHGVTAIVSDERVQETGGKAFELMNAWLDEQIHERTNRSESEESSQE